MENIQNKNGEWHKHKRKMKKIRLFILGTILLTLSIIIIYIYNELKQDTYITYKERTNVNYQVNLKENEFYENSYLGQEHNIIASLIENIDVKFMYNLEFDKDNEYYYDYKIIARTEVKESQKINSIYEKEEELLSVPKQEVNNNKLLINENAKIDYNRYNEMINKFVNVYGLNNTDCTLELIMQLNVYNKYDNTRINEETNVMTLFIPLTTKTVDISISANTIENVGTVLEKKSIYGDMVTLKIIAILFGLSGIGLLIELAKYIADTRSAEKMYDQTLKSIMFNYKQYIQKVNTEIEKDKYKVMELEEFNEILEMKETLQAPILMYTEKGVRRTKFMIVNNDLLFVYTLGSQEIREKLIEESKKRQQKKN